MDAKAVFQYFEQICAIPHGSGNLKAISDYLVAFANERNLSVTRDSCLNVIIKKKGSAGREEEDALILQGHIDMVAVAEENSGIDMKTHVLDVKDDNGWLYAEKTSLGGDDGIAVAMCLSILDDDTLSHPPLEIVLTAEEETGMDGARALDASLLSGRRLINIDSEDEGVILAGCAGGVRFNAAYPVRRETVHGTSAVIRITGLLGGHSGAEIHLYRGNANLLLARILHKAMSENNAACRIVTLGGGVADNAIPSSSEATLVFEDAASLQAFTDIATDEASKIANELAHKDKAFAVTITPQETDVSPYACITDADARSVIGLMLSLPNGVQEMSASMEGLVETSLNLGVVRTDEAAVRLNYAVRSSIASAKHALIDRMRIITERFGATVALEGDYPGWEYIPGSELQKKAAAVWERMTGKSALTEAIHAGVECGFFAEKIPGIDCISIGPDMRDVHTPRERLSVKSTERVYLYLLELLKEL